MNVEEEMKDFECFAYQLSYNEHQLYCLPVTHYLEECALNEDVPSESELSQMISSDTVYTLQVYPRTPVAHNVFVGATEKSVWDQANAFYKEQRK